MKTGRLTVLNRFLVLQFNHWALFSFVMGVMLISAHDSADPGRVSFLGWFVLGLIPLALDYVSNISGRNILVILLHVIWACYGFLLPTAYTFHKVLYVTFSIGYAFVSLKKRYEEGVPHMQEILVAAANSARMRSSQGKMRVKMMPLPAIWGISIAMVYALHYWKCYYYDEYYLVYLMVMSVAYLITRYMNSYDEFYGVNETIHNYIPAGEIFRSGLRKVLGMCAGMVALAVLFSRASGFIGWLLDRIWMLVAGAFRGILHLLTLMGNREEEEMAAPDVAEWEWEFEEYELIPESDFWHMVERIVIFIMVVLITFAVIYIVRTLWKFFKQRSTGMVKDEAAQLPQQHDVREKFEQKPAAGTGSKGVRRSSVEERMRKIFRSSMEAKREYLQKENTMGYHRLSQYTARDYGKTVENPLMAQLYEKARYSGENCDKADLKKMREASKKKV